MNLENWFVNLMETLKQVKSDNAGSSYYNYSILFGKEEIEQLVDLYENTKWIEIY